MLLDTITVTTEQVFQSCIRGVRHVEELVAVHVDGMHICSLPVVQTHSLQSGRPVHS